MTVVIQAGHVSIHDNIDWGLRGATGAPGESDYTPKIAAEVAGAIQAHGIDCIIVDANFNGDAQAGRPYDAFVALHCQSDPPHQSGFGIGVENPTEDQVATESQRLATTLSYFYAQRTGLQRRDNWMEHNVNVSEYYMFGVLNASTPCCLLEMGNMSVDKQYLEGNMNMVASGIVDGILSFLKVDQPAVAAEPDTPTFTETNPDPETIVQPTPEVPSATEPDSAPKEIHDIIALLTKISDLLQQLLAKG